jgi:hypothetical protein
MGNTMKKSLFVALICALASVPAAAETQATGAVAPERNQMLFDASGARLAPVYRVNQNGSVAIIIHDKLRTIQPDTLSLTDGKLTTNLTKSQLTSFN